MKVTFSGLSLTTGNVDIKIEGMTIESEEQGLTALLQSFIRSGNTKPEPQPTVRRTLHIKRKAKQLPPAETPAQPPVDELQAHREHKVVKPFMGKNADRDKAICEMFEAGGAVADIASVAGLSSNSVYHVLKKYGFDTSWDRTGHQMHRAQSRTTPVGAYA